ncbi:MAG: hypothetical protein Q8O40_09855 [Chloroflexota bacterium]|nr:hypothetical protein [Chloroflexota bacterium]
MHGLLVSQHRIQGCFPVTSPIVTLQHLATLVHLHLSASGYVGDERGVLLRAIPFEARHDPVFQV